MAGKKGSIFKQTNVDKRSITVKIDPTIHASLETLEARLEKFGGKLALDRAQIVEDAFEEAIQKGNAELDAMGRQDQAA